MNSHAIQLDAGKVEKLKKITGKKTYKSAVEFVVQRFISANALDSAREKVEKGLK